MHVRPQHQAVTLALVMWRVSSAYSPVAADAARLVSVFNGPVVAHLMECLEGGDLRSDCRALDCSCCRKPLLLHGLIGLWRCNRREEHQMFLQARHEHFDIPTEFCLIICAMVFDAERFQEP